MFVIKDFQILASLTKHKRTHSGDKLYRCDLCEKRCSRSTSMTLIMTVHKRTRIGEKPYQREVCGRRFSQTNHLREHEKTHIVDKPYQCDVCGSLTRPNKRQSGGKFSQSNGSAKPNSIRPKTNVCHELIGSESAGISCICGVCGQEFDIASELESHVYTHCRYFWEY